MRGRQTTLAGPHLSLFLTSPSTTATMAPSVVLLLLRVTTLKKKKTPAALARQYIFAAILCASQKPKKRMSFYHEEFLQCKGTLLSLISSREGGLRLLSGLLALVLSTPDLPCCCDIRHVLLELAFLSGRFYHNIPRRDSADLPCFLRRFCTHLQGRSLPPAPSNQSIHITPTAHFGGNFKTGVMGVVAQLVERADSRSKDPKVLTLSRAKKNNSVRVFSESKLLC